MIVEVKDKVVEYLSEKGDTTPHYVGAKWLAADHAAPRYVWVPTRDAPNKGAPRRGEVETFLGFDEGISVHCWGTRSDSDQSDDWDFRAAYQLRNNLAGAIRAVLLSSWKPEASGWLDPTRDGWVKRGQVYVFNFSMGVPIVTEFRPVVEIGGVSQGVVMVASDGSEIPID